MRYKLRVWALKKRQLYFIWQGCNNKCPYTDYIVDVIQVNQTITLDKCTVNNSLLQHSLRMVEHLTV